MRNGEYWRLVTSMFQVKTGMRNMVIPGARMLKMVATKLTAPRMPEVPAKRRPMIHRFEPLPGEKIGPDSGTYPVQPNAAAPPTRNPEKAISPPLNASQ